MAASDDGMRASRSCCHNPGFSRGTRNSRSDESQATPTQEQRSSMSRRRVQRSARCYFHLAESSDPGAAPQHSRRRRWDVPSGLIKLIPLARRGEQWGGLTSVRGQLAEFGALTLAGAEYKRASSGERFSPAMVTTPCRSHLAGAARITDARVQQKSRTALAVRLFQIDQQSNKN